MGWSTNFSRQETFGKPLSRTTSDMNRIYVLFWYKVYEQTFTIPRFVRFVFFESLIYTILDQKRNILRVNPRNPITKSELEKEFEPQTAELGLPSQIQKTNTFLHKQIMKLKAKGPVVKETLLPDFFALFQCFSLNDKSSFSCNTQQKTLERTERWRLRTLMLSSKVEFIIAPQSCWDRTWLLPALF